MSEVDELTIFLDSIRREGKSSPSGMDWSEFHQFLARHKKQDAAEPPMPLILAASGESAHNKHRRFGRQLQWAIDNGCLQRALDYIASIPDEKWNQCGPDKWFEDNYF